ncbi:MAG: hypothetical protein LBN43_03995 [Oscillospiraceae bacterium]|jgi:hypothetical protein|nr:hypothetical protein [Oscillospiraceae bacterium]
MTNVRKRRWGDRKDGRLLRTLAPFYRQIPFIMKATHDCQNAFDEKFEISEAESMIRRLRNKGYKNIGILHVFLAAYVRVMAEYPALNRFIAGQRVFARNQIEVSMVVKKQLSINSGETSIKVVFEPTDTIREVYEKINTEVEKIKTSTEPNKTEQTANTLMKIPRLPLKFIMWMLTVLDYFGKMPMSLINVSPFHSSLVISDLGSVGISKIFHHLYDFGNLPVLIAFGKKYRVFEIDKDGKLNERRYIDYGAVCDERICDGYYYAISFRHLNHYLHHPEILERPPKTVNSDID